MARPDSIGVQLRQAPAPNDPLTDRKLAQSGNGTW